MMESAATPNSTGSSLYHRTGPPVPYRTARPEVMSRFPMSCFISVLWLNVLFSQLCLHFIKETPHNTQVYGSEYKSTKGMTTLPRNRAPKVNSLRPEARNGYRPGRGSPERIPSSIVSLPSPYLGIVSFDIETDS